MYNEIRSRRNISGSVRSIDIKDKLKNIFNENIAFKKINGGKTNTKYVMSKKSYKIVDFENIQSVSSLPNWKCKAVLVG